MSKQFTLYWYKELGWINDPFRSETFYPLDHYFTGYDAERHKINYFIIEGHDFGLIKGEDGNGKTLMLRWLENELSKFKGNFWSVYVDAEKQNVMDTLLHWALGKSGRLAMKGLYTLRLKKGVEFVLRKVKKDKSQKLHLYDTLHEKDYKDTETLFTFLKKRLGDRPLILMIDNAELIDDTSLGFLQAMAEKHDIRFVMAGTVDGLKKKKDVIFKKDKLGIKLRPLSFQDMRSLVAKRIVGVGGQGTFPFNDSELQKLYDKADKNTKDFLKLCYDKAVKKSLEFMDKRKAGKPVPQPAIRPVGIEGPAKGFDIDAEIRKIAGMPAEKAPKEEYKINVVEKDIEQPLAIERNVESDNYHIKEVAKKEYEPEHKKRSTRSRKRKSRKRRK